MESSESGCLQNLARRLFRTKQLDISNIGQTELRRCLGTLDLTALGIGATLGAGIYIVAGQVAKDVAGPAVVLSFAIAAVASIFAGLCYAEFGARIPKSGSAYVYSYVTVGELWAFIIGWNLLLEYVIGTSSVARAFSSYFDSLVNNTISNFFQETMPMNVPSLSSYPDLFAFAITITLTLILCLGVKESSMINNIFTVLNLLVVIYVILVGLFKIDVHNWNLSEDEIPGNSTTDGVGGFMPFGFSGMMSGAATCFYAFVGFDVIATTAEEVQNPQKAIPIAIIISLTSCFIAYFSVSAILTLMVPYFMLDAGAPLPDAFLQVGWPVAKYVIAIGAVAGLSTSLLGSMFPMPRIIYAMAQDGIIFRCLSYVPESFKTPVVATLLSGTFAACGAMLFDLKELVDMMSIGTLLAYTIVAMCILLLRYRPNPFRHGAGSLESINLSKVELEAASDSESSGLIQRERESILRELFSPSDTAATFRTQNIVNVVVGVECLTIITLDALLAFATSYILRWQWVAVLLVTVLSLLYLTCIIILFRQPESALSESLPFKVPCVQIIASISMFINIYLMMKLNVMTWIRFGVWLAIGFLIYFGYGIRHSSEEISENEERRNSLDEESGSNPTSDNKNGNDYESFG